VSPIEGMNYLRRRTTPPLSPMTMSLPFLHGRRRGSLPSRLRFSGTWPEAEDVVQETLTAAWKSWETIRDPGARPRWLTRILSGPRR
jgi:Sigma-70 region 2